MPRRSLVYPLAVISAFLFMALLPVNSFSAEKEDLDPWFKRVTALENQEKWEEADALYQEITQTFPSRPEGWFFYGQSLVGRKRFGEAVAPLEKARELAPQVSHPYLLLTQCYVEAGRFDEAREILKKFSEIKPQSGDADFWHGKIHTSKSDWKKASEYFENALQKNTQYRAESRLGLAVTYLHLGEMEKSKRYFDEGMSEAKSVLVPVEERRKARPWDLSVGTHGFYTSNVLGTDNKTLKPDEIPNRGDFGTAWYLDGGVKPVQSEWFDLQARYSYYEDAHVEAEDVNILSNAITLQPRLHHDRWYVESDLGWQHERLAGDPFRFGFLARPAVGYQWKQVSVRTGYGWGRTFYHRDPTNADQNRDNDRHTWFTDMFYFPKKFGIKVITTGIDLGAEDDQGADYDQTFFQGRVGLKTQPYHQIRLGLWSGFGARAYEDANSLAAPSPYSVKRHSANFSLGTELSRPLTKSLTAFTRYNYSREYSNITIFSSTSHTVSVGCRYEL